MQNKLHTQFYCSRLDFLNPVLYKILYLNKQNIEQNLRKSKRNIIHLNIIINIFYIVNQRRINIQKTIE